MSKGFDRFENLTPHPIDIYRADRDSVLASIVPSGIVVRLREDPGAFGGQLWLPACTRTDNSLEIKDWEPEENYALSVPCVTRSWGDVVPSNGMHPREGTIYIIPMPVLVQLPVRDDVCCPDFGDGGVRNSRGSIVGTRRLVFRELPPEGSHWRWFGPLTELLIALK